MSFLVCSFPTLIPFPIDITTFLSSFKTKQNKTFHFGLFSKKKKSKKQKQNSKGCTLHPEGPLTGMQCPARKRMDDRREKHTHIL